MVVDDVIGLQGVGVDHLSLDEAVREIVHRETGERPVGPIRLLTHLRYFGYCFNPAAFFFVYSKDGSRLESIVLQVTNTPWFVVPVGVAGRVCE